MCVYVRRQQDVGVLKLGSYFLWKETCASICFELFLKCSIVVVVSERSVAALRYTCFDTFLFVVFLLGGSGLFQNEETFDSRKCHRLKCMVIILQNGYVSILATSCFMCLIANQENTIAHQTPERFKRNKTAEFTLYSRHTEWPDYGKRGMFCYCCGQFRIMSRLLGENLLSVR